MDGGGRLLEQIETAGASRARFVASVASANAYAFPAAPPASRRLADHPLLVRFERFAQRSRRGLGLAFSLALITAAGLYGAVRGGQFDAFVAANGTISDNIARALGFGISAVSITSQGILPEADILKAAGITPNSSLPFLDVAEMRQRLMALPAIADANIRKLYPDRLTIEITERPPFALWQKEGVVSVISDTGAIMGPLTDLRLAGLPFVVGEGANQHAAEFVRMLEAAGDQKQKFRAGIYVGQRRWDLQTTSGIIIHLPDRNAEAALKTLAELERQNRILEKDVLALDMRMKDRVVARLTEGGAASRSEQMQKNKMGSDI